MTERWSRSAPKRKWNDSKDSFSWAITTLKHCIARALTSNQVLRINVKHMHNALLHTIVVHARLRRHRRCLHLILVEHSACAQDKIGSDYFRFSSPSFFACNCFVHFFFLRFPDVVAVFSPSKFIIPILSLSLLLDGIFNCILAGEERAHFHVSESDLIQRVLFARTIWILYDSVSTLRLHRLYYFIQCFNAIISDLDLGLLCTVHSTRNVCIESEMY